jgi:hypothetical protein
MPASIIILGEGCAISFELERLQLKGVNSLFEWHLSNNFNEVLVIFEMIANGKEIYATRNGLPGNYYLADTSIRSSHYENVDYETIIKKRYRRLREDIIGSNKLIFIRDDTPQTITEASVKKFCELVLSINPSCDFRLLIFSKPSDFKKITYERLSHYEYNVETIETHIKSCFDEPPLLSNTIATDMD